MVKLKGPIHALEASGTIADILTIAADARGAYARRKPIPSQPRTPGQLTVRALMKWLAQEWQQLTPAEQATWQEMADARSVAPYHCFVAENHHRWTSYLAPSKEYPATEAGYKPKATNIVGTGGPGYAEVTVLNQVTWPDWGWIIYRDTSPMLTKTRTDARAFIRKDFGQPSTWRDTPLAPGTYYYACQGFHTTGKLGFIWGDVLVNVT